MTAQLEQEYHCGYVAVVGRPNVGKSTLINRLLGQKISITSRRPQTTRHRILGIKTGTASQAIYVDTPGLHDDAGRAINRYMNRAADSTLGDVDMVIMLVEALKWSAADRFVMDKLLALSVPLLLAVNKVDKVKDKERLLPYLAEVSDNAPFTEIIPLSAKNGDGIDLLEQCVERLLPRNEPIFPEHQLTDRSMRFLAAELIREKLMRRLGDEVPYRLTVQIETYQENARRVKLSAIIWVDRKSHKAMVVGRQGQLLKSVGSEVRGELEQMLEKSVHLETWVKVKENWYDDERMLRSLGYDE